MIKNKRCVSANEKSESIDQMEGMVLALVAQYVQNVLHEHSIIFRHSFSKFFRKKRLKKHVIYLVVSSYIM
jgi:hypothetical protein